MANKQLTASVRLNTTQFEQKLRRIARGIDALNNSVGRQSNAYQQVNSALNKQDKIVVKVKNKVDQTTRSTKSWVNSLNKATSKLTQCKSLVSGLTSKMGRLAGLIFGIGSIKLAVEGADTLTGAQNRFNNIAAQQMGDSAYTKDSSGNVTGYSQQALNFTQETMDKIYTSAQKTRTLYSDMLSNVSKTMTLAPNAFQGNIDNAIRFQEIMAEAYAVGGASAAEMSTSMYQLTQALGSGVLAGDELRSVREGAPLAYQAIEKFAQGVLKTTDSLKDLASEGKITSEMVVAAVTAMGDEMDTAFALTKYRFTDVWTQIKSAAQKAFSPVVEMMTDKLNELVDNGIVQKLEQVFVNIAKAVMIAFVYIEQAITWVVDNFALIKSAIIAVGNVIVAVAIAVSTAWLIANWQVCLLLLSIWLLTFAISAWKNGSIDACTAVGLALLAVAAICFLIFGWQVALIIAIIALVVMFLDVVCGVGWVIITLAIDICQGILNAVAVLISWIIGVVYSVIAFIVNLIGGLLSVIGAFCQNVGIAFENCWNGAASSFWNFIADCIDGLDWLAKPLEAIAELFGKSFDAGSFASGLRDKANGYGQKSYVDYGDAWSSGWNTMDWYDWFGSTNFAGSMFGEVLDWNVADTYNQGASVADGLNNWASQFQNKGSGTTTNKLDALGNELGLTDIFNKFDNIGSGTGINPDSSDDLLKNAKNISDNTGSMADSMELTEEDLEYLRKLADMEWKKEYTTANITVDMSNYNTINGENDLDGIVTKLSEKLTEELNVLANGVYA